MYRPRISALGDIDERNLGQAFRFAAHKFFLDAFEEHEPVLS